MQLRAVQLQSTFRHRDQVNVNTTNYCTRIGRQMNLQIGSLSPTQSLPIKKHQHHT